MATPPAPDDELARLRGRATRWLSVTGGRTPARHLAALPGEMEADTYGEGGVVAELEDEVADLLGHEAALFLPTGTMAQGIALRLHAEDAGYGRVAMHPTAHPLVHEAESLTLVHGLNPIHLGHATNLPSLDDLDAIRDPLAAVLVELPARELGGRLPAWDDLLTLVQAIRDRGAAVHLDGARLWECEPAYGRDAAEIAGLFDTVYVSFYKGLGAIAGACLVGDAAFVGRAATWRHRLGGRPYGLWPDAASALVGLRTERPEMGARLDHLRTVAGALADLPSVEVVPDPPEAALCRVYVRTDPEAFRETALAITRDTGVWVGERPHPTDRPGWQVIELAASANLQAFSPDEVREVVARLAGDQPASAPSRSSSSDT